MIYREIDLKAINFDSAVTEIMFEVAGARADGTELIRLNIVESQDAEEISNLNRMCESVERILKGLKQKGLVQFFAVPASFIKGATEASFLINKYPDLFATMPVEEEGKSFIYVKI